jgi:hypothetical protein
MYQRFGLSFLIVLCSLANHQGKCQGINLDEIRTLTHDSTSKYFYDTLVKEFFIDPRHFEMTKGMNLYYGKLYSRYYRPYAFNEEEPKFDDLMKRGNYAAAVEVGERILEKDPVNFELLLKLLKCYQETKQTELAEITNVQARILHNAILYSGTGETMDSPIKVIAIADEYVLMSIMELRGLSRKTTRTPSSVIDSWKVQPSQKGPKREMHFEVLLNLDAIPKN